MDRITWVAFKVEGTQMKEVNLGFIYELGAEIHLLTECDVKDRKYLDIHTEGAEDDIKRLFNEYPDLMVCEDSAQTLIYSIRQVKKWTKKVDNKQERINKADINIDAMFQILIDNAKEFEHILIANLGRLNIYYPLKKGGYDTRTLLSEAEHILGKDILPKIGEDAIRELREFGRCLVFDNYTASGFHILRGLEIVLHNYYIVMCKPSNPERLNSWWEYHRVFKKTHAQIPSTLTDKDNEHLQNVINLLDQIRTNHRNLIMHPEEMLNEGDSLHLANITKTAIGIMAEKL